MANSLPYKGWMVIYPANIMIPGYSVKPIYPKYRPAFPKRGAVISYSRGQKNSTSSPKGPVQKAMRMVRGGSEGKVLFWGGRNTG